MINIMMKSTGRWKYPPESDRNVSINTTYFSKTSAYIGGDVGGAGCGQGWMSPCPHHYYAECL